MANATAPRRAAQPPAKKEEQAGQIVQAEETISEKFVRRIERQFRAEMGAVLSWSPLQKTLAQHLYVKIDAQLQALEIKRASNNYKANDPPIIWANVNMTKLAIDGVHRIYLELDAFIANHIHVIPYLNKRTGQYDIDLRIGYSGVDHVARKFSLEPPLDIRYQLVHEGDHFDIDRSAGWEQPVYEPKNFFKPGEVVGGFGYITYEDARKNRVVVVEYREFEKARKASQGVEFWGGEQTKWEGGKKVNAGYDEKFEKEMQYKTVVFRVTKHIALDPVKVNQSMAAIEAAMNEVVLVEMDEDELRNANKEEIGALPQSTATTESVVPPEPTAAVKEEAKVETKSETVPPTQAPAQTALTGEGEEEEGPGY